MPTADERLAADLAGRAGDLLVGLRAHAGDTWDAAAGRELGRQGDLGANELLLEALAEARPDDAVLSEESADDPVRLGAERVWIIDPLDGTREFALPGRTDWAVHVGLWELGPDAITAAAVALPAQGRVFDSGGPPLLKPFDRAAPVRTVVSESRPPSWLPALGEAFPLPIDLRPLGSAGAKAMAVLQGDADAYVHSGGQYEWDSAAPVGVVLAAGLHASRLDGSPLRYNRERPYLPDLVICRPEIAGELLGALAAVGAASN